MTKFTISGAGALFHPGESAGPLAACSVGLARLTRQDVLGPAAAHHLPPGPSCRCHYAQVAGSSAGAVDAGPVFQVAAFLLGLPAPEFSFLYRNSVL